MGEEGWKRRKREDERTGERENREGGDEGWKDGRAEGRKTEKAGEAPELVAILGRRRAFLNP